MESVISETQTAFVKDRQIFKVNFEKAYDSMNCGYLDAVMGKMTFLVLWRKWIKECVTTTTSSVLFDGSPTNEFPLKNGSASRGPSLSFSFPLGR